MITNKNIPHRTISPEQLAAIEATHPLEAGIAHVLLDRGIWTLADDAGPKKTTRTNR